MNSKGLRIGLVQVEPKRSVEENLEVAWEKVEEASSLGVELLVFPEMFMMYPRSFSLLFEVAQDFNGEFVKEVLNMSKKSRIFIVSTFWELAKERKVYNTAFVASPEGRVLTTYRKLHLFDAFELAESRWMIAGDRLPDVIDINGLGVCISICYDLRFPELYRQVARKGAHLVLVLSAWYRGILKEDHWITLLRARAIENTIYVAGAGCLGKRFCGRSCVVDPFGVVVSEAGEEENILCSFVSLRRIEKVREKLPVLRHIREDLFFK